MLHVLTSLKIEMLLFALVFFPMGYFTVVPPGTKWHDTTQVYSLINPDTPDYGTFRINYYMAHPPRGLGTGDWARRYQGKYYSNKAAGSSILGAVIYFFLFHGQSLSFLFATR